MRTTKQQQQAREQRVRELLAVDGVVLASSSTGYIGDYNNQEAEEVVKNLDINEMRKTKQESKQATPKQIGGDVEMQKTIEEQLEQLERGKAYIDVEVADATDSKSGEVYVSTLRAVVKYFTYKDGKLDFVTSVDNFQISRKNYNRLYNVGENFVYNKMKIFNSLPYMNTIDIAEGSDLMEILTKYINEKLKNKKVLAFFDGFLNNFLENIKDIPEVTDNKDIEGTDKIIKNVTARKIVRDELKKFGGGDLWVEIETVKDWRGINQTEARVHPSKISIKSDTMTILEDNKKGTTEKDLKIAINDLKKDAIAVLNQREFHHIMQLNRDAENFTRREKLNQFQDGEPVEQTEETKQQKQEEAKKAKQAETKQAKTKQQKQAEAKKQASEQNQETTKQAEAETKKEGKSEKMEDDVKMHKNIEEQFKQLGKEVQLDINLLEKKDPKTGEVSVLTLKTELYNFRHKEDIVDFLIKVKGVHISNKNCSTYASFEGMDMEILKQVNLYNYVLVDMVGDDYSLIKLITEGTDVRFKHNYKINLYFNGLLNNFIENIKDIQENLKERELYKLIVFNKSREYFKKYKNVDQYIAEEEEKAKQAETEEKAKQEAEKAKQEAEKAKQEAEKAKQEAEKAKQEAEKAKQEAKRQAEAEEAKRQAQKQQKTEDDVNMEKMEEMMALVQELNEQNKKAIAKIEQLEAKIEENKPFYKKIVDKVKKAKDATVAKVKEVKDATVAKVKEVKDATVAKVKEVTLGAVIAIIPSAVKEEIKKQGNQAEETKQATPKQETKQATPKQETKQATPKQETKQASEQRQEKQEPKQETKQASETKQETSRIDAKVQNIEKARIKKIFKEQGDEVALFFNLKTLYRVQTVGGKIYNIKKDSTADEIVEMIKVA